jgi:hypothetical protein
MEKNKLSENKKGFSPPLKNNKKLPLNNPEFERRNLNEFTSE